MKTNNRNAFVLIICLLTAFCFQTVDAQQTVNCYPQNLVYWTGTCSSSTKTQSSYVYAYANFPPSNPNANSNNRGWMKFDISAIPDGSTINDIKVHYYISAQNNPYYRITKLALEPVTAGANAIYTAIGLATSASSSNTYFDYQGAATSNWNVRTLNAYGKTDLQAALPSDYFCIGFYEHESGSYYLQAHGWNQANKPYLEVTYTPNFSNDIGILGFVTPLAQTCQGQDSIRINIRNYGINNITTATINWSINGVSQTNYIFNGNLAPGAIKTITLSKYTFNPGSITFFAEATGPNNASDPNPNNNNKLLVVQVSSIPVILTQPTDDTTTIGGNATFGLLASGAGVTYRWQQSTDNGLSFTNLSNTAPYGGVTTKDMVVTNAQSSMTGYLYRCYLSGTCSPDIITDTVMLIVGDPIHLTAAVAYACPSQPATVPLTIQNMNNIQNFKISLTYNNQGVTYLNTTNVNPAFSAGTWLPTVVAGGLITLEWNSATPVSIVNGTLCNLNFTYNTADSPLNFTTSVPNSCYFKTPTGIKFPTNYTSGVVYNSNGTFLNQPQSFTTGIGDAAIFSVNTIGVPDFQWQYSTDLGTSWVNVPTVAPYAGGQTNQLIISNCTMAMNNYKFRVIISGCSNTITSNEAILNVIKIVKTKVYHYQKCLNDLVIVPIRVWNFDSIGHISLTLNYDQNVLQWVGTQNLAPGMGYIFINNVPNATLANVRIATYALSNISIPDSGIMVELKFNFLGGCTPLSWDTINQGFCEYSDVNLNAIPGIFTSGSVCDAKPVVSTQPPDTITILANQNTSLGITATGIGTLTYQWQFLSTASGAVWSNCPSTAPYSGEATPTLTLTSTPLSYAGYQFRCIVSGMCSPATSSITLLNINPPPIYCTPGNIIACFQDTVFIPINVENCNDIQSFNLKLRFNSTQLTYNSFIQLNPLLTSPANFTVTISGDTAILNWTSSSVSNLGSGYLVWLKFLSSGIFCNSQLNWDTVSSTSSYFRNASSLPINTSFTNGEVCINLIPTIPGVISGLATICRSQNNVLYSIPTIQYASSYVWTVPNGASIVSGQGTNTIAVNFDSSVENGNITVFGQNSCGDGPISIFSVIVEPLPGEALAISGQAIVCQGTPYSYSTGTISNALSYTWTLPTGATGTSTNNSITVTFTPPGGYLQVVGTNSCGNGTPFIIPITVNPLPVQPGTIAGIAVVCQNQNEVEYTIPPVNFATSGYIWSFPTGATIINGAYTNGVLVNFGVSAISGAVTVRGQNTCGLGPASSIPLTVNNLPVVTQTSFPDNCINSASFSITGGLPAGGTYSGTGVTGGQFSPSVSGVGTFPITYTYTDGNNCTNSAVRDQVIRALPLVSISSFPSVIFGSLPFVLTGGVPNGGVYSGPGVVSNTFNPQLAGIGVHTITYAYTDLYGCSQSANATLEVIPGNTVQNHLPDVIGCTGLIDIPVVVDNVDQVSSISLTVLINSQFLGYSGYANPNPLLSTGTLLVNSTNSAVQVGWFSISPVSISNDTLIVIRLIAAPGTSSITWDLVNPGACYYTDAIGNAVPATYTNGSVTAYHCSTIQGNISYTNSGSSPMTGATINLNGPVGTDQQISDLNGNFEFNQVKNGTYYLEPAITKPWGGVNAIDALIILRHFVNYITLTGQKRIAADVDGTNFINSSDALVLTRRFVNLISSFSVGDWVADKDTLTVTGPSTITSNLKALCYGDVDASFIPALKIEPSVFLCQEKQVETIDLHTVAVPFHVMESAEIGAISLVLTLPSENIRVKEIKVDAPGDLQYSVLGNEIRISWYSLIPMQLNQNDRLLTMILDIDPEQVAVLENEWLQLLPESQFGDAVGIPLSKVRIGYPKIRIGEGMAWLEQNVPNPYFDQSEISYGVIEPGNVSLKVLDLSGRAVLTLAEEWKEAGTYNSMLMNQQLVPGIYIYRLEITTKNSTWSHSKRLIVTK
jgi:hypothetical protein